MTTCKYEAIVIGGSAGGLTALAAILPILPEDYPLPIIVALHLHPLQDRYYLEHFDSMCALNVQEADEKGSIQAGQIYFAPPNYHLLVENDKIFSLSIDARVNYSRPSIDVLFESAAETFRTRLIGVILTGANHDGAEGLRQVKEKGGLAIVQDPQTAESTYMPKAALEATTVDHVLPLSKIGEFLLKIVKKKNK